MKLYIKQKVFSIGDKYNIYDENGNIVYNVWGEILTIGAKLRVCNVNDQELYFIKQKITLFLRRYEIYKDNDLVATVQQEFTFFSPHLTISSKYANYDIKGDFLAMNFDIYENNRKIGAVRKKWLSWGDSYELDAEEGADRDFFATIVIAIDNCIHREDD